MDSVHWPPELLEIKQALLAILSMLAVTNGQSFVCLPNREDLDVFAFTFAETENRIHMRLSTLVAAHNFWSHECFENVTTVEMCAILQLMRGLIRNCCELRDEYHPQPSVEEAPPPYTRLPTQ